MSVTIWHNPRCSKSRQTLALLTARGLDPAVRLYLLDRPTADELRAAVAATGRAVIDHVRTGEPAFRDMGLSRTDPDERLIAALAEDPTLIQRPLVLVDNRAAIGRPPEAVLSIL